MSNTNLSPAEAEQIEMDAIAEIMDDVQDCLYSAKNEWNDNLNGIDLHEVAYFLELTKYKIEDALKILSKKL